jgi:hypothetical protein
MTMIRDYQTLILVAMGSRKWLSRYLAAIVGFMNRRKGLIVIFTLLEGGSKWCGVGGGDEGCGWR